MGVNIVKSSKYTRYFDDETIDVYYNDLGYTDVSTITEIELWNDEPK